MRKLETLAAWTHGKYLAKAAYTATLQKPLKHHFGLADQIRRAANSVPANIIEGYALATRPQLLRCLRISFASACELLWHLEMASDLCLLDAETGPKLRADCDREVSLLVGLIKKLDQ